MDKPAVYKIIYGSASIVEAEMNEAYKQGYHFEGIAGTKSFVYVVMRRGTSLSR